MTVDGAYFFVRVQAEQGLIVKNHTGPYTHHKDAVLFHLDVNLPRLIKWSISSGFNFIVGFNFIENIKL